MQNSKSASGATRAPLVIGLFVGAVLVVALGLILRQYGPGNMGNGVLQGGAIALIAIAIVAWRAIKWPDKSDAIGRTFAGSADERDDTILTRALATVGVIAVPLTALATVALALGYQTEIVMVVLMGVQLLVAIGAFIAASKKA